MLRHTIAGVVLLLAAIGCPFAMKILEIPIGGLALPFWLVGLCGVGCLAVGEIQLGANDEGVTVSRK